LGLFRWRLLWLFRWCHLGFSGHLRFFFETHTSISFHKYTNLTFNIIPAYSKTFVIIPIKTILVNIFFSSNRPSELCERGYPLIIIPHNCRTCKRKGPAVYRRPFIILLALRSFCEGGSLPKDPACPVYSGVMTRFYLELVEGLAHKPALSLPKGTTIGRTGLDSLYI